jgi:hypothetical protein
MNEESYKNPQWQRKRLEIMQKKGFKCEWCSSGEKELHTHHLRYEKGKELWEYEDSNFMILCKDCHKTFHIALNVFNSVLSLLNESNRNILMRYMIKLVDDQGD